MQMICIPHMYPLGTYFFPLAVFSKGNRENFLPRSLVEREEAVPKFHSCFKNLEEA